MTPRERIYEVARRVPRGRVATYGDVARLTGNPRAAREVGRAMAALPEGADVPWWRIVNRLGAISCRSHGMEQHAELLRAEGVEVSADGSLDLARYRWDDE
ncbi:MAG TPA: methylated-DNA--[protein]-cysteine S-methyltransferase [Armatimonadota bacterium]|nr:methylated-DNA--[protein]-cysteine S-methyltransferase [Armatimonadota bacterium]